jgi:hypothetical protein
VTANMFRQTIIIIIFLIGYLSFPVFAVGEGPAYRFIKEPAIKWKDERLTGEIKNAPVKNLITELLWMEGSNWEVIGKLEDKISISFDHLTINESINKIMRISRYNYALIFEEQEPIDSMSAQQIKELTIYQKDQRIRFSRTQKQINKPKKEKIVKASNPGTPKSVAALPAKPAAKKPIIRNTRQSEPTREEIAAIDKELRAFADEMFAEKKITQEEYNELIREMETEK